MPIPAGHVRRGAGILPAIEGRLAACAAMGHGAFLGHGVGGFALGEVVLQPPTAAWRILSAGALLVLVAWWAYRRTAGLSRAGRRVLAGLRLAAIVVLTVVLLGPSAARWSSTTEGRRTLVLAMDTSASFGTKDVNGRSRFDVARQTWLAPGLIERLRGQFDLRFFRYDAEVAATGPGPLAELREPTGRQTYLASAVTRLLETEFVGGVRAAGVLLIGDGHETGFGDPAAVGEAAGRRGVPIWTSCFGGSRAVRDLAVRAPAGPVSLFTGQTGRLAASVSQTGFGSEEARVTLLRDGRPVQERVVAFDSRTVADASFDIREDRPGVYAYEIHVEPLPGEGDAGNNTRAVFVRVSNERIKVLLVEGEPYWDTKFLAQSLRADPQIELTQIVAYGSNRWRIILPPAEPESQTRPSMTTPPALAASIPRSRAELFAYDVLILGKGLLRFLPPERLPLLKEYLDARGGGIVFARGRAYDPTEAGAADAAAALAPLEPAVWGEEYVRELRLDLTDEGRQHPAFGFLRSDAAQGMTFPTAGKPTVLAGDVVLRELPGLIGAVRIQREKAAALVLARAGLAEGVQSAREASMAALAYQNHGRGRVVSVLGEGLWRWAMPSVLEQAERRASPFDEFWRRMVRWLATGAEFLPGQDVSLTIARFPERPGDEAGIEVRLKYPAAREIAAALTAIGPDGGVQALAIDRANEGAGLLRSSFRPERQGMYRVRLTTPEMTPAELETRFCVYEDSTESIDTSADPEAMRTLAERSGGQVIAASDAGRLPAMLDEAASARDARPTIVPAWDRPWVFAAIVTLLSAEWYLRRRSGVP